MFDYSRFEQRTPARTINKLDAAHSASVGSIALALAGAGAILVFSTSVFDSYGLPKLAVASFAGMVAMASRAGTAIKWTPTTKAVLAMLLVILVTSDLGIDPARSLNGAHVYFQTGFIPSLVLAILFWAAAQSPKAEGQEVAIGAIVAAGAVSGAYGGLQAAGVDIGIKGIPGAQMFGGRVFATAGGPVYLGAALVIPCVLSVRNAIAETGTARRLAWVALCALTWGGIAATGSRGAMGSAMIGVCLYFILAKKIRANWRLLALAAAVAFGVFGYAWNSRDFGVSDSSRIMVWKSAANIFMDYPMTGVGPDNFGLAFRKYRGDDYVAAMGWKLGQESAHNDILEVASTMGVVGLFAYILLLLAVAMSYISAIKMRRSKSQSRDALCASAAAVAALLIQAKVNPVGISAMAPAAILAGYACAKSHRQKEKTSKSIFRVLPVTISFLAFFSVVKMILADSSYQSGETARAKGAYTDAIRHHQKAISLNKLEADYLLKYGATLLEAAPKMKPDVRSRAIAEFAKASEIMLSRHNGDPRGWHMAALAHAMIGAHAEASLYFEAAQERDPWALNIASDHWRSIKVAGRDAASRLPAVEARVVRINQIDGKPHK